MKWLITGLGGTLAPVLAREAASQGVEVIGWKRDEVSPDDLAASQACCASLSGESSTWTTTPTKGTASWISCSQPCPGGWCYSQSPSDPERVLWRASTMRHIVPYNAALSTVVKADIVALVLLVVGTAFHFRGDVGA